MVLRGGMDAAHCFRLALDARSGGHSRCPRSRVGAVIRQVPTKWRGRCVPLLFCRACCFGGEGHRALLRDRGGCSLGRESFLYAGVACCVIPHVRVDDATTRF